MKKGIAMFFLWGQVVALSVILVGCATNSQKQQPVKQSTVSKSPTKERYVVDIINDDKSLIKPAKLPGSEALSMDGVLSGKLKCNLIYGNGAYIVQIEPAERKPLRVTLFGVPETITWSNNNTELVKVSSNGREAILDFNQDAGDAIITAVTGDSVVIRLKIHSDTAEKKERWGVRLSRIDEQGDNLDIYGEKWKK